LRRSLDLAALDAPRRAWWVKEKACHVPACIYGFVGFNDGVVGSPFGIQTVERRTFNPVRCLLTKI